MTITQKLMKLEKKLLIMIMVNILLKYITPEFNQMFFSLKPEHFAARLERGNLARKNDIAVLVKNTDFDEKLKKIK